jgi:phosphoglycerol transferase
MDNLSFMTIAAVLIGTIGGISAIIAQVFPDIHSYNRISLFIAFFGILAVLYLLQLLYEQYKAKMFFCPVFMVILLAVVSFGVYDQVPSGYSFTPGSDREIEFLSQQSYFQHIEDIMPTGASIFILPDIGGFPHSSPPGKIKGLDSMKPYLHTSDLKWNYPTMKGRFYDNWQVAIANSPVTDMIHHLYLSGFEGVLVDGFGYDDGGLAINKEITNTTGVSPRISVDSRYAFFDLTGYMAKKKSGLTIEQFESEKQKYLSTMQGREELQNPLFGVQIRSIDK